MASHHMVARPASPTCSLAFPPPPRASIVAPMVTQANAFRADHIGSLLRPAELVEARHAHAAADQVRALEDRHIERVLARQAELDLPVVTDGELRRLNFMSDLTDAVDGFDQGDSVARTWQGSGAKVSSVTGI